jgi:uncharacterized lipoprotein YehR (DUF1307 family)
MNKNKLISLLFAIIMCVSLFVGCGEKSAVSTLDFEEILTEKGYNVNVSAPSNSPCITAVARKNYDILFYEFVSDDEASTDESDTSKESVTVQYAQKVYDSITNELDMREKTKFMHVQVNLPAHSYSSFNTSEKFYIVSRVEHTIMFASVPLEYKEEVIDVFDELGYN